MTLKHPFLSIIIPTRNEEKRLNYCLPSILNQEFKNFELIVVDDPKTSDNTAQYIKSLNDKRIKYIVHQPNIKVPAKRNIGAKNSTGTYLYIIDADMEMPLGLLQSLHDQLLENPVDMMFVKERTPGKDWLSRMKDIEKQVIQNEVSLLAARIYDTETFKKSGGYLENLIANEEVELSDRLITEGKSYGFSTKHINHYETSGGDLLKHLKKKFKYGTTASDYLDNISESGTNGKKRTSTSRLIYFTSAKTWQYPFNGIQFVLFKFVELSSLAIGLIYSKIFKVNTITTNK